jgi:hypothetical protein
VGPERAIEPVLPTFTAHLTRLLDRTTTIEAPSAVRPTGLTAEAAWRALEEAGASVREALTAGDGLALGTRTMPQRILGEMPLYYFFAFNRRPRSAPRRSTARDHGRAFIGRAFLRWFARPGCPTLVDFRIKWARGGMAEWSMAVVLKTIEPATVPGVRIPLPPPNQQVTVTADERARPETARLPLFCPCLRWD